MRWLFIEYEASEIEQLCHCSKKPCQSCISEKLSGVLYCEKRVLFQSGIKCANEILVELHDGRNKAL